MCDNVGKFHNSDQNTSMSIVYTYDNSSQQCCAGSPNSSNGGGRKVVGAGQSCV